MVQVVLLVQQQVLMARILYLQQLLQLAAAVVVLTQLMPLLVVQVAVQAQVAVRELQAATAQLVKDTKAVTVQINHQDTAQVAVVVQDNLAMLEHLLRMAQAVTVQATQLLEHQLHMAVAVVVQVLLQEQMAVQAAVVQVATLVTLAVQELLVKVMMVAQEAPTA